MTRHCSGLFGRLDEPDTARTVCSPLDWVHWSGWPFPVGKDLGQGLAGRTKGDWAVIVMRKTSSWEIRSARAVLVMECL